MKKIMYLVAIATVVFCFMACGNSKTPAAEQNRNEAAAMEEVADTTAIDTSAVVTRGGTESEGFGRCLESGCYCKEFKGRGQTCRNCGHAYRRHY